MAKIVVNATGASGNFFPFFLIAKALKLRGHRVIFATGTAQYKNRIEAAGIEYQYIREQVPNPDFLMDPNFKSLVSSPKKDLKFLLREIVLPSLREAYEDLKMVCETCDLLVTGVLPIAASLVHEKTGIPWISFTLQTGMLFSSYQAYIPRIPWLGFVPKIGPALVQALQPLLRIQIDQWTESWFKLRRELYLPLKRNILYDQCNSPQLQLAAFSAAFFPRQPDWPSHRHHTGFIFPDDNGHELSQEVVSFLENGESPLIFTLGGAAHTSGERLFTLCINLLKDYPVRTVISCGEISSDVLNMLRSNASVLSHVLVTGAEPYDKLFPRARAVVHHGGMGTLALAMREGVPAAICAVGAEHPSNGYLIKRLGLGTYCLQKNLSPFLLKKLISEVTLPRYKERAQPVAERVRAENGLEKSIYFIEELLSGKS